MIFSGSFSAFSAPPREAPVPIRHWLSFFKRIANIGEIHTVALPGIGSDTCGDGGSGGARTRNLCRDRAAL